MRGICLVVFMLCLSCAAPVGALASAPTGGASYAPPPPPPPPPGDPSAVVPGPQPIVPGVQAVLLPDGTAAAPADAPPQVQAAVWAANTIQKLPYRYGGGHASFLSRGYDCSGTVSFALNAAGLLKRPRDSSGFMRYGARGPGQWFTIYTNPGHAYMVIAGLRLDTSSAGAPLARGTAPGKGPRWRATGRPVAGYKVRHPRGF
jgi:hypothetical protein